LYPSPLSDKKRFVETVLEIVKNYSIPLVMPVVESTVIAIDEYRDQFEPDVKLAIPSSESLAYALDKIKTYEIAASLGISIPKTCCPASAKEAYEFAKQTGFPIIMKPRAYSSYRKVKGTFGFKIRYAKDLSTLQNDMQEFEKLQAFPMLQEYCAGVGVPQSVLCASGEIIGIYQHRRGRDYPLTGGVASVVISEAIDPELRRWTEILLGALKWDGIAQVEYRVDRNTGRKVLFEINGRFWAPVSAAIKWGLNYPYALYQYVMEGVCDFMPADYPLERRNRYLRGDLIALEGHLLGMTNNSIDPLPGKGRVLWEIIKDFRPAVKSDVGDWSDPLPTLYEYLTLIGQYGIRSFYYLARFLTKQLLRRK
jgi:predicted ATP-grasp superfamily ATP-dependent carboligase